MITREQLAAQVLNVLDAQRTYFRSRKPDDLVASKDAEKELRRACDDILDPPGTLFGKCVNPTTRGVELKAKAAGAIRELFAERTLPRLETHTILIELWDDVGQKLDSVEAELEREQAKPE